MTLTSPMPPPPVGRRGSGERQARGDSRGVFTAGTPRNDFRLDVTRVEKEKYGTGKSAAVGHRCPNLGPTRQDTLLYFKTNGTRPNTDRHKVYTGSSRYATSGPPKTAPSAFPGLQGDNDVRTNNEFINGWLSREHTNFPGHGASSDNSGYHRLCVSSMVLRRENTSSRPGSYVSEYYIRPSPESMVTLSRTRMSQKREKVITPSKHGYHPRSHSPTFKRLLQASDKLSRLLETLSSSVITSNTTATTDARRETTTAKATSETEEDSIPTSPTADNTDSTSEESVDLFDIAFKSYKGNGSSFESRPEVKEVDSDIPTKKHHMTPRVGLPNDITVDYRQNGVQGAELHFFLPNIFPTYSDRVSVRTPEPTDDEELSSSRTSKSLPKLSPKVNPQNSTKPKNGYTKRNRIISKRSLSPTKPVNKDKQRKGRVVEEREPFLRGESLKERLEDFPTLVSLDTS